METWQKIVILDPRSVQTRFFINLHLSIFLGLLNLRLWEGWSPFSAAIAQKARYILDSLTQR